MPFKIGPIKMQNSLVLAPMYRVTDLPFRLLCRQQGASLCYSEMVNSEALIRNNKAAERLTQTCREDRPLTIQIFGSRLESMRQAAKILLSKNNFDFLDLNLGCPSSNIITQGAGSVLMRRPKRLAGIIGSWSDLGASVTAKTRSGQNVLHTIRLAKSIERAGAQAIAVHARPAKQINKGFVDLVAIKRVKKAVGIPVIGNGGVRDKEGFGALLDKTGCDAVMVGTAAIGNPGIFAELLGRKPIAREQAFLEYAQLCKKFEIGYFGRAKQQAIRFFSGNRQAVKRLEKAESFGQLVSIGREEASA